MHTVQRTLEYLFRSTIAVVLSCKNFEDNNSDTRIGLALFSRPELRLLAILVHAFDTTINTI